MPARDYLPLCWQAAFDALGVAREKSAPAVEPWLAMHEGGGRYYHTLGHVYAMTRVACMLSGLYAPAQTSPIVLTCFFHDCVYDPRAKDNEEQSALRAESILRGLGVDEAVVARTSELILVTKTHEPGDDLAAAVVCDADLKILGTYPSEYDDYAAAIRQEYAFVPDDKYRQGRIAVLEGFMERPSIYRLPIMAAKSGTEWFARTNLERELKELREARP